MWPHPSHGGHASAIVKGARRAVVGPPSAITAPSSFPAASGLGRNVLPRELGSLIRGSLLPADFSSGWALPERQITPRRNLPRWWWQPPETRRSPSYGCWQGRGSTIAATWCAFLAPSAAAAARPRIVLAKPQRG